MVGAMGCTPEELEEMFNAQITEAECKAAAMNKFVATLKPARVTGPDSCREVEVEVNQEGIMTRVSTDDEALEGSTPDLEEAIMKAYFDAGKNMSCFLHEQGHRQFGGEDSAMGEFVGQTSSRLEQLGCWLRWVTIS